MTTIFVPSHGPDDWQQFLAEPEKHWKTGYSARSMAYSWEEADGLPAEVAESLAAANEPRLTGLAPLLIVPEFKVDLPGGGRASQNDAFVLARNDLGLVAMTIEGKVNESFGPLVTDWGPDTSPGKRRRLDYLAGLLELDEHDLEGIYYQLLHRTASALIAARDFHADTAVMLVHSFSQEHRWFNEYAAFARLMGIAEPRAGELQCAGVRDDKDLWLGWAVGNAAYLKK